MSLSKNHIKLNIVSRTLLFYECSIRNPTKEAYDERELLLIPKYKQTSLFGIVLPNSTETSV
ncbi:9514_t:CDS:2 [Funneliformis geosporum]|nr:9514_t:CDS:2 [Funneliformis geosporum]